jgi:uncharacterized integral membrane protein
LKSYIGFFTLLWFTWFQVALFDIRFGNDSAFERLCKLCQFGVMIGIAVESKAFNFAEFDENKDVYRNLSLILMVSRFVLAVQYAASWWFVKGFKKSHLPLILHIVTMVVSGFILLGLSFGFNGESGLHASIGWWIIFPIEALVILHVSDTTKFLNFRRTNLIERLGLLTLIILGEGMMNLGESLSKIKEGGNLFTSDIIGQIICSVLIVYFLYMLYFDQIETTASNIGNTSQQIWTLGHYPLHVCILLVVAGFGQFTIWRKMVDFINETSNLITNVPVPDPQNLHSAAEDWVTYIEDINATVYERWPYIDFTASYDCLKEINITSDDTDPEINNCLYSFEGILTKFLAEAFEVELPESLEAEGGEGEGTLEGIAAANAVGTLYGTVFLYFFIAAGLTLVILALLFILGKKHKTRIEWLSIGFRLFVGACLALIASFYADMRYNFNVEGNFLYSAWMIPTVALSYGLSKFIQAPPFGIIQKLTFDCSCRAGRNCQRV